MPDTEVLAHARCRFERNEQVEAATDVGMSSLDLHHLSPAKQGRERTAEASIRSRLERFPGLLRAWAGWWIPAEAATAAGLVSTLTGAAARCLRMSQHGTFETVRRGDVTIA